jgi:peroxiredoxin
MMKRIGYILCLVAVLSACKDKTKFTIKGKFENFGDEKKVFLYGVANSTLTPFDSTSVSENGEFKFVRSSPQVDLYSVHIGAKEYMLIAKNGDVVELTADLKNENGDYKVTGDEDIEKLTEFNKLKAGYSSKIEAIKNDFERQVASHPENREMLIKQFSPVYMKAIADLNNGIAKFAKENTSSLVSFYAISLLNPAGNETVFIEYADKLSENLKKNYAIKAFVEKINKLKKVQVGQMAPDFSIQTIDGKKISLADLKGKYAMIDFWASWCAPCRAENPNVVKAYNKYKSRNFMILGISLDKSRNDWESAIKQDNLTWTHASELMDFDGETVKKYNVESIPSSLILDPSGKIIARNLRGEELDAFLNKTLP